MWDDASGGSTPETFGLWEPKDSAADISRIVDHWDRLFTTIDQHKESVLAERTRLAGSWSGDAANAGLAGLTQITNQLDGPLDAFSRSGDQTAPPYLNFYAERIGAIRFWTDLEFAQAKTARTKRDEAIAAARAGDPVQAEAAVQAANAIFAARLGELKVENSEQRAEFDKAVDLAVDGLEIAQSRQSEVLPSEVEPGGLGSFQVKTDDLRAVSYSLDAEAGRLTRTGETVGSGLPQLMEPRMNEAVSKVNSAVRARIATCISTIEGYDTHLRAVADEYDAEDQAQAKATSAHG